MRNRLKPESLERARALRRVATGHEMKLWWELRAFKPLGLRFRRQVPFRNYILDFAEHRAKLVVELDGSQHGLKEQQTRDRVRDDLLNAEGYRVLRFWNGDIDGNLDGVVDAILREALACVPAPHPAHFVRRPPHEGEVKERASVLPRRGLAAPIFRKPS
jgi:very-short-patch-repair endonuclease